MQIYGIKSFKTWLEGDIPKVTDSGIPHDEWSKWTDPIDLFVYGDMLLPEERPLSELSPARVRGVVRVFDVPISKREAGLSIRRTGRLEDTVNGGITTIPGDYIQDLATKYKGYELGRATAVRIDDRTGLPLKSKQDVYFLFRPDRVSKKLQPNKEKLRNLLKAAYDFSPAFGEEFIKTTFRLPKRGNRLVRITR